MTLVDSGPGAELDMELLEPELKLAYTTTGFKLHKFKINLGEHKCILYIFFSPFLFIPILKEYLFLAVE